jgi:ATP-dependent Lon protease
MSLEEEAALSIGRYAKKLLPETLEVPDNVRREIERLQRERDEARKELRSWQETAMEHDDAVALTQRCEDRKQRIIELSEERDELLAKVSAWEARAKATEDMAAGWAPMKLRAERAEAERDEAIEKLREAVALLDDPHSTQEFAKTVSGDHARQVRRADRAEAVLREIAAVSSDDRIVKLALTIVEGKGDG